jgi:hypothetical protein
MQRVARPAAVARCKPAAAGIVADYQADPRRQFIAFTGIDKRLQI